MKKMQDEGDQFVPLSLATVEAFGKTVATVSRPRLHAPHSADDEELIVPASEHVVERAWSEFERPNAVFAQTGSRWRDRSRMVADRR